MRQVVVICSILLCTCQTKTNYEPDKHSDITSKIKSIKTYFVDEYGDQDEKNGEPVGYALFADDGTLMTIKTTNSRQTMFQSNARLVEYYKDVPFEQLIWAIDGGVYGQQWRNITGFLTGDLEYPRQLGKERVDRLIESKARSSEMGGQYDYYFDDPNKPTIIEVESSRKIAGKDQFLTSSSTQNLIYDDNDRILRIENKGQWNNGVETNSYDRTEIFAYTPSGYLSNYTNGDLEVQVMRSNEMIDRINVVKEGRLVRYYTFQYLENGLRSGSSAYNQNDDLEFSIEYAYEFYE